MPCLRRTRCARVLATLPFLLAVLPALLLAQAPADSTGTASISEQLLEEIDDDAAAGTELSELLSDLREHPLDINAAPAEALAQLPTLTPSLSRAIVAYRRRRPLQSLPELRQVDGVSQEVYLAIRPYLRIGEQVTSAATPPGPYPSVPAFQTVLSNLRVSVLQRVGRRLEVGPGFADDTTRTTYAGSPMQLYTRLRVRYERRVQLALALEKDAGERFAWQHRTATYGFDHVSGHLSLSRIGRLKSLVIGDYVLNLGQGLLLWRTGAFGKGSDPVGAVARVGNGIDAFASSTENTFFRGVAGTLHLFPALTVTAFASRRRLDASLTTPDTTLSADRRFINSLRESGLHRTPSELAGKDAVREVTAGGAIEWNGERSTLGIAAYHARYDEPFVQDVRPYALYHFADDRLTSGSFYGSLHVGNAYLFGETALSPQGAWAGLAGALFRVGDTFDGVILGRHYPRDFHSLHGYAFGERSGTTQNEEGLYLGLRMRPARRWTLGAYYDQYRFPYLRFATPRPTVGHDLRVVIEYRPRRWLDYHLQLRSETREAGTQGEDPVLSRLLRTVRPETRQSARFQIDYRFSRSLDVRARLEGVRWHAPATATQYGLLLYQQLQWEPSSLLRAYVRLTFFDTDDWQSRVYTYENDLLYAFSVPVFSGRGQRAFVLLRVAPTDRLTVEAKAAVTHFEGVDTIGSGLDEIEGRRLREVRAQLRWHL